MKTRDLPNLLGVMDLGLRPLAVQLSDTPGQAWCKWVKLPSSESFSTSRSGWYAPGEKPVTKSRQRVFWFEVLNLLTEEGNLRYDCCHCLGGVLSLGGPGFTDAAGLLAWLISCKPTTALEHLLPAMGRYGVWLENDPQGQWRFVHSEDKPNIFAPSLNNKERLRQFLGAVSHTLYQTEVEVQANFLDQQVEKTLDDVTRRILGWPARGPEGQFFYTQEKIALWQLVASMLAESPHNLPAIEAGHNLDARQHLEGIKPPSPRCQRIQQRLLTAL